VKRPGAILLLLMLLGSLGGCSYVGIGYIGPPMAPTLDIPLNVTDLRAMEYGDKIQVAFTISDLTTEGLKLTSLRSVDLFAGTTSPPIDTQNAMHYNVPASVPGPVTYDEIPVQAWIGKNIILGVHATGPKKKTSGWSNFVQMTVGPPLQAPTMLAARNLKDGVGLTWQGTGSKFRVLRAAGDGPLERLADVEKPEYLDGSAQFGTKYQYRVLALSSDTYMSIVSEPPAGITPKDTFPPDVPTGVTAAPGANTIEVAWDRNTEADFKGYNVFRSVDGGPFQKVSTDLIETPIYSDNKVELGKTYRYEISAVDLLGNESAHSAPPATTALP
jgi:fibronectin type 3 domain-containing protein